MPARKGITDDDVLAAVETVGHKGTSAIADELGIERRSAYYHLQKLREKGEIDSYDVGGSFGWERTDTDGTS